MMKYLKQLRVAPVLAIPFLVLFLTVHSVSAQKSSPFYWEFINVEIDVQENGDMLVAETQKYVFTAPHTNERYRWRPLSKTGGIDSVELFEGEEKLPATAGVKNNRQWIKWRHELNPPESHTFVIKYRVKGGLHIDDNADMVYF